MNQAKLFKFATLAFALLLFLAACSQKEVESNERGSQGDEELRRVIQRVLPKMESFELVKLETRDIVKELNAIAAKGAENPERVEPIYVELPVVSPKGELVKDFVWTVYPHNLRAAKGTPVIAFDPENEKGEVVDRLTGPSLTFQGVPNLSGEAFAKLAEQALAEKLRYDERRYQPSVLNVVGNELEGAYYGPKLEMPSVIESLSNLLGTAFEPEEVRKLLANTDKNYIVYSQANFQPGLNHVDEKENQADNGDKVLAEHNHAEHDHGPDFGEHSHGNHDHGEHSHGEHSHSGGLGTQGHALEDGWKYINLVPVADDTIYDPSTNDWKINNWFARMEASANRMNLFNVWMNLHADIPATGSTLATRNNRFMVKAKIREYRVLTNYGKSLISHPSASCSGNGSYRDVIRGLSNSTKRFDNEIWVWGTKHNYGSVGGCAYTEALGMSPRGNGQPCVLPHRNYDKCGAIVWISFRNNTQDRIALLTMHETGHTIGGRHDNDASGSTGEADNSQRCRFLFWNIGPTGPSVMSYASGDQTYCFAWSDADGTPKRNASWMAQFMHPRLTP